MRKLLVVSLFGMFIGALWGYAVADIFGPTSASFFLTLLGGFILGATLVSITKA